jgi:hypothetical protein
MEGVGPSTVSADASAQLRGRPIPRPPTVAKKGHEDSFAPHLRSGLVPGVVYRLVHVVLAGPLVEWQRQGRGGAHERFDDRSCPREHGGLPATGPTTSPGSSAAAPVVPLTADAADGRRENDQARVTTCVPGFGGL